MTEIFGHPYDLGIYLAAFAERVIVGVERPGDKMEIVGPFHEALIRMAQCGLSEGSVN